MPDQSDQQLFFIDSELIERLMGGDSLPAQQAAQAEQPRPIPVGPLTVAVALASEGRLEDAANELKNAAAHGEDSADVQASLGHVLFEQEKWVEAETHYAAVTRLQPQHSTAHYNLGLSLERQGK